MKTIPEPSKDVPVAAEADVVVAGGGISGMFAALAAARGGAKTVLIDRFGALGGNMGPGMYAGGTVFRPHAVEGGYSGVIGEFNDRLTGEVRSGTPNYPDVSHAVSYVMSQMMKEAGVRLMLSTYVADPIMDGQRICGLFVENKSGRQAVTAKVVVDATGNADLAYRAGAPVIRQTDPSGDDVEETIRVMQERFRGQISDADQNCLAGQLRGRSAAMGLWFIIGGVDWQRHQRAFEEAGGLNEDDVEWYKRTVPEPGVMPEAYGPFVAEMRKSWEAGDFRIVKDIDSLGKVFLGPFGAADFGGGTMACGRMGSAGQIDPGNGDHISIVEVEFRAYLYEFAGFLRRYAVGFENAYLFLIAPFLDGRAGRYIVGEHSVTAADLIDEHRTFDDVIYIYKMHSDSGAVLNVSADVPYRMLVAKGIDGLLATGRSASYGRSLRTRVSCMHMGQAGGTAAALCVRENATPRELDIRLLQRELLNLGCCLGPPERLAELGLD